MRFQRDAYSCGVFAIINAAEAFGVGLTERAVRAHTGTTKDGTTQHGILNALERLGFTATEFKESNKDEAFDRVWVAVTEGKSVLLCVEESDHWVAAIGVHGRKRLITFDSWKSKTNAAKAGIDVWTPRTLRHWWTKDDGKHYGIILERFDRK